ncbi:MAG: cytochrome b/b6 domain-containing protein [Syntrophales bacterium]|nr:cytochrome b/b6 domain-containing protein [Syntrophales bacterium]
MNANKSGVNELEDISRVIHLGLTVFGISAWATGFLAEDYKHVEHLGFSIHSWLGISFAFFLLLRIGYGFWGPDDYQFAKWVPYTMDRLRAVLEDLWTLIKFKLPERPMHVGLSGLVQTFGLAAFAWMAVTGSLMFFYLTPGHHTRGLLHFIKEMHEAGVWLIPIYLGIHMGAVLLHALAGDHRWRRTFFLKE